VGSRVNTSGFPGCSVWYRVVDDANGGVGMSARKKPDYYGQRQQVKLRDMISDLVLYSRINAEKIGVKGYGMSENMFLGDENFKETCLKILEVLQEDVSI
jgi:hypothetical protein